MDTGSLGVPIVRSPRIIGGVKANDISKLMSKVASSCATLHVRDLDDIEAMINSEGARLITRYVQEYDAPAPVSVEDDLVAMSIMVNKKHYDEPLETYDFIKNLINENPGEENFIQDGSDIYWITTVCTDQDKRQGLALDMIVEALRIVSERGENDKASVVATSVMIENSAMCHILEQAGFVQYPKEWNQSDFHAEEIYDRTLRWYIYYRVV